MSDERRNELRHLTADEIERLAIGGAKGPEAERLEAHLHVCSTCGREVESLRALDAHLKALPLLETSPAFAMRVMARVRLPQPWRERARAALGRRWTALAAGVASLGVAIGGMAYWLFGRQELTPSGLIAFVAEGLESLALQGAILAGRILYDLGLVQLAQDVLDRVALPEAAGAMALVSLAGVASLLAMKKLMDSAPRPHRAVRS